MTEHLKYLDELLNFETLVKDESIRIQLQGKKFTKKT